MATELSTGVGDRRGRWRTRANALSLARMLAAPALFAAIRSGRPEAAALLIAFGIATDLCDGALARRFQESSPLGGLLDHAADALFVSCGLGALALEGVVPGPLPVLIVLAFAQYVFDSQADQGRPLRGSRLGRWNGIAYFVVLAIPVVRDALALGWPAAAPVQALGWALVASTVASILARSRAARATGARSSP